MLFKSQVLTQASGSIGGITYSRNRGGMYQRARAIPTNPASARQTSVRANLGSSIQAWLTLLTGPERDAWRQYAAATPTKNALGDSIILSGQNMWVRYATLQMQAAMSGLNAHPTLTTAAPTMFNTGEPVIAVSGGDSDDLMGVLTVDTTPGTFSLNAHLDMPASSGGYCYLFVGRPQNASRNFFRGPYQLCSAIPFAAAETEALFSGVSFAAPTEYLLDAPLVVGERRPIRLLNVFDDNRVSQDYQIIVNVTAFAS